MVRSTCSSTMKDVIPDRSRSRCVGGHNSDLNKGTEYGIVIAMED